MMYEISSNEGLTPTHQNWVILSAGNTAQLLGNIIAGSVSSTYVNAILSADVSD